jgi:hypothetical protein
MQNNSIIPLVKQAMLDHIEDHGEFLDDKDYEQWFVKYYLHFSTMVSNHPTSSKKKRINHSRSLWAPENMQTWMTR